MADATQTAPGPSDRVRLAQLSAQAAVHVDGVAGLDSGPAGVFSTVGGTTRVGGVTCASAPGGGYDVSLRLVCALVDLHAVADRVRDAVQTIGAEANIEVAAISIVIADVTDDEAAAG